MLKRRNKRNTKAEARNCNLKSCVHSNWRINNDLCLTLAYWLIHSAVCYTIHTKAITYEIIPRLLLAAWCSYCCSTNGYCCCCCCCCCVLCAILFEYGRHNIQPISCKIHIYFFYQIEKYTAQRKRQFAPRDHRPENTVFVRKPERIQKFNRLIWAMWCLLFECLTLLLANSQSISDGYSSCLRVLFFQLLLVRLCFFLHSLILLSSCTAYFVISFFFLFNSLLHFDFISAHTIRTYDNNINSVTFLCVRSTHLFDFNRSITLCNRFFQLLPLLSFFLCQYFVSLLGFLFFSILLLVVFFFFCLSVSHYICRWCLIKSGISVFYLL